MPVIITRGYGDDSFVVPQVSQDIAGTVVVEEAIFGTVISVQEITGTIFEEGPCMITESDKITIFSGDDRTLSLSVNLESDGSPVELTGAKIWFTVKSDSAETDAAALVQKRNAAAGGGDTEILITDAAGGQAQIFLIPSDTEDADAATYQYDIQVILATGKKHTITRSLFCVLADVTKTVS